MPFIAPIIAGAIGGGAGAAAGGAAGAGAAEGAGGSAVASGAEAGAASSGGNTVWDKISRAYNDLRSNTQSNYTAYGFPNSPNYNPDAFNFGGYANGANDWSKKALQNQGNQEGNAQFYGQLGVDAQSRAVYEDPTLANRNNQSRAQQIGAVDLARNAAEGNAPSEAAYMMQRGLQGAQDSQMSQAAGARGSAALANAQGNANANIANLQNQAFTQGGQLRANEMANARSLYGGLANNLNQSDQNRLQMGNQMGQFNRNANDQYQNNMAQLGLGYRQLGQGYFNTGVGIQGQQLGAQGQQQGLLANDWNNANQINAGVNLYNTNSDKELMNQWTGMLKSAGGSAMGAASGGGGGGGGGYPAG